MHTVKQIFEEVKNVSSTKAKELIVLKNKENEKFLYTLKFLLDDDITTGLSTKKIDKKVDSINHINNFQVLCEYLKVNNTGTDEIIGIVKGFIENQPNEMQEFYKEILTKKYRLGLNAKGVNKIIPNFIPKHEVMLANKFEGELKEPVSMSLKLDGIRCSALIENGNIKFLSRQGKPLKGLNQIESALRDLQIDNMFVDGELIRVNKENLPSDENFRLTTRIVNSDSLDKRGLEFVIFDMTFIEDYHNKKCLLEYFKRLEIMNGLIGANERVIKLVDKFGIAYDVETVYNRLDEVVGKGYEGLMLNTLTGKYEFGKRPKSILKVKKFNSADVLVVDVEEGTGRLKGKLGALKIQFKYKGKIYENSLGSGFTDDERKYYWEHQDEIIGKVIEIKYFEITENKNGGIGFRFPVWQGKEYIRFDKKSIDDTNIE